MKKLFAILLSILMVLLIFASCSPLPSGKVENAVIDYGVSSVYSAEDLEIAVESIKAKIKTWHNCELLTLQYAGDKISEENLSYCQSLSKGKNGISCAVFVSSFKTDKSAGGFNANTIYENWMWYLVKDKSGQWAIVSYGYC